MELNSGRSGMSLLSLLASIIGVPRRNPTRDRARWRLVISCGLLFSCLLAGPSRGDEPEAPPEVRVLRGVPFTTYEDAKLPGRKHSLRADLYFPPGEVQGSIILIHGGGWVTGSKLQMSAHARRFAKHGYLTMAIDYRLAPKYKFPAQIEDCWAALRWLSQRDAKWGVDPNKIAAVGYSAGGHLACLMGTTSPRDWGLEEDLPQIRAVVAGGAPCNFEILPPDKSILANWLGGTRNEVPHQYRKASPIVAVSSDDPPTFFYHGGDDQIVPSHISRQMALRLDAAGVPVEYYLCEEKGHISTFFDVQAGERSVQFLNRQMSTRAADGSASQARQ